MKILIIEDEKELVKSMAEFLRQENYVCETAYSAHDAEDKILLFDYDCILLDINLPDGSGLRILEKLKENNKSDGVIIITANNSLEDRVLGLNLGADDYLAKPFFLPELSARVSAIIRRKQFGGSNKLAFREINIDLPGKIVKVNNTEVDLTRKEYDLLMFLLANKNRVVSKNAIAEHLSGDNAELLDKFDFLYSHIKNLKRKLADAGSEDYIKTVYGLGYKFSV
ncbi:response regulator transcription factor [Chryseolinea lacunae]|uniref:Response regulator transcription factor n=1 Tax=Chryseolinea lacunae TaxID=2801331 RepID=A0ABS1KKM8_9BACT|nr:response regulator transcription factor [Chryseolinea lacunae]MBL0739797.1 response regulator transcription factor [Chryseolinea lacunae]